MRAALNHLLEDSKGWGNWCTALDVLAESCRLGLGTGFARVQRSIADKDGSPIEASWLWWGDGSIVTTAQWMFFYPSPRWRYASGAEASLALDHKAATAFVATKTAGESN